MTLHTVIFIGRSGCGKGTQAELLRNRIHRLDPEKRPILYVETGDHFRRFIRGSSFSARRSRELMEEDVREPDFLGTWMWADLLISELDEGMHLVFDGAPRALAEAQILTTALRFYKREKPTIIHLKVSREWSEERLLARGRADDQTLAKIDKRLDWFDKDVLPAIEYFRRDPYYRLIEVDGEQKIEEVHRDIIAAHDYQA